MADKVLVSELMQWVKQDKLLQWQQVVPWINNFAAKKVKGVFDPKRAAKALGDYMTRDTWQRYAGKKAYLPPVDAATKLLFGRQLLSWMAPRINSTAKRMKEKGVMKGRLNMTHPMYPHVKLY